MSESSPEATAGAESAAGTDPAPAAVFQQPAAAVADQSAEEMLADAVATDDSDDSGDDAKALEQARKEATKWKELSRKNEARARENAGAADELKALKQAQMSEQERLSAQLAEAQATAERERGERLRLVAVANYDLPAEAIDLLRGSTEEEINGSAEQLAALINSRTAGAPAGSAPTAAAAARGSRPVESLRPGALPAGDAAVSTDPNDIFRAMAGRK